MLFRSVHAIEHDLDVASVIECISSPSDEGDLNALAIGVGNGVDGFDQAVLLAAIDLESEAVVVQSFYEIKASAGEANRCNLDCFSTVVAEIQQSVIRDVGSRGGDVADVSAIELLPVDTILDSAASRDIYDRVLENRFTSVTQDATLSSADRAGREQVTRLRMHWKNYRDGNGDTPSGILSKTLVRYFHPFDIRHSGYLVIHNEIGRAHV